MNAYIVIFYILCGFCAAILLYVFRDGLRTTGRWLSRQYNALPAELQNLLHGYIGAGIAYAWLHVLHWSTWLLIVLSAAAVVYTLVRYTRAERRDLDKRIRQMLDSKRRSNVLPVLFLFATAGIGWLGVWAWWILTHEVR